MDADTALWSAGIVIGGALVAQLASKRIWRILPTFFFYVVWNVGVGVTAIAIRAIFTRQYFDFYLVSTVLEAALEIGVLIELTRTVLHPVRISLPAHTVAVLGIVGVVVGAAIWRLAASPWSGVLHPKWNFLMTFAQAASILNILFFLALIVSSQLLWISWRDRELQVAAGLGFSAIVGLAVASVNTHLVVFSDYVELRRVEVAAFNCVLLYWLICFTQKEPARRASRQR